MNCLWSLSHLLGGAARIDRQKVRRVQTWTPVNVACYPSACRFAFFSNDSDHLQFDCFRLRTTSGQSSTKKSSANFESSSGRFDLFVWPKAHLKKEGERKREGERARKLFNDLSKEANRFRYFSYCRRPPTLIDAFRVRLLAWRRFQVNFLSVLFSLLRFHVSNCACIFLIHIRWVQRAKRHYLSLSLCLDSLAACVCVALSWYAAVSFFEPKRILQPHGCQNECNWRRAALLI